MLTYIIRLAKLVKRTKARLSREADGEPLSIDDAFACHTDVKHFIEDLSPAFHLDGPSDVSQRCELAMTAQRLILQVYLPFLNAHSADSAGRSHATVAAVQAAHQIVHVCRILHAASSSAAVVEEHAYGQTLFSAGVVCAHAVIGDSNAIWAREGLADVNGALEVLHAIGSDEAAKVVQFLLSKAEATVSAAGSVVGVKRKRGEVEDEPIELPAGFCLPYAGPGAAISSGEARKDEREPPNRETPALDTHPSQCPDVEHRPSTGDKGKGKQKKLPHPSHGVRKRSADTGPPYMREKNRDGGFRRCTLYRCPRCRASPAIRHSTVVHHQSRKPFHVSHVG